MSSYGPNELVLLIHRFLEEENYKEAARMLEQESGFFFSLEYIEEKVIAGEWEEVEKYLSGFTKVDDNRYSTKIYFEIRKQKYLEALDRQDKVKAIDILLKDLKVFSAFNEGLYKQMALLLTLGNFRENEQLSVYGDTNTARSKMAVELKKVIRANPVLREKLLFSSLMLSRLRHVVNQSLNWQHHLCADPSPEPEMKTLFVDHNCSTPNWVVGHAAVANPTAFASPEANGPFPPAAAAASSFRGNPPYQGTSGTVDYQGADNEQFTKRTRLAPPVDELAEIIDPVQCRLVTIPDSTDAANKVTRLLYTNSGTAILSLGSNGIQMWWKWIRSEQNPSGKWGLKATANVVPQQWQPNSGLLMINDTTGVNHEELVPCMAVSNNESYVVSACGGMVSLFNMVTFKVMTTFMTPPPASTFLAFHPLDNNILAVGMEDSTIHIYNVRKDEVKSILKGHEKRISGLAFSINLNILVSSGGDAQLCVWSIDTWESRKSVPVQLPAKKALSGDTQVQFHSNHISLLVSHETQLAIYDASKMDCICRWVLQDVLSAPISYAAYSCNSQLVYASFCDGNVGVFDADTLRLRCRIAPSVYLSPDVLLNGSQVVYTLVIAAHPEEPNQFAIGLTDGTVKVLEPSESVGTWGVAPPSDNEMVNGRTYSSSTTSNHTARRLKMKFIKDLH